jgi:hypothetical protein
VLNDRSLLASNGSLLAYQKVSFGCSPSCRASSEAISVFSVDAEGRHVTGECSEAGQISPANSLSYKLKLNTAFQALEALSFESHSTVAHDTNSRDRDCSQPMHVCATILYKTGAGSSLGTVDMPLFGVLVCIRPLEEGAYMQSELAPMQSLTTMAAEQMIHIAGSTKKMAGKFLNTLLRRASTDQAPRSP